MNDVSIQLLGTALLRGPDGQPIALRRRARLLVFYVAALSEPIRRERIATLFWPDEPPESSRQLLRTALHQIKLACGPILSLDTQTIALDPAVAVDVRALAHAQPGDAVVDALVSNPPGAFCADLDSGGIEAVETWVDSERARWHRRLADVLLHHAQWLATNGNVNRAIQAVTIAISHEPLREESSQLAMRLHMRAHDRAAAIACYEALSHALDDQLGVPPLPATAALYNDIVTDRYVAPAVSADVQLPVAVGDAFVGRQAELTILHGLPWDGRVVMLSGPPGIGKTRLAQEYLRRSNALIVHAIAYAGDEVLPYHTLSRAIRTLLQAPRWHALRTTPVLADVWQRELRRLWPELAGGEPDALLRDGADARLPEAVALLVQHLAEHQRIVLFFDDAQWLDDASAKVFLAVIRRGLAGNWQVLATIRPGPLPAGVAQLTHHAERTGVLTRLAVSPLSEHESLQLARSVDPRAELQRIGCAEGNPLFVMALVRSDPGSDEIPAIAQALTQSRFASLSPAAHTLAVVGAVAGRAFDAPWCGKIAHLDEHTAAAATDELVQAGIVVAVGGGSVRFDHPLTVEAIIAGAGPATLAHFHRDMAQQYAATEPVDHARVARHYTAAGRPDDALPHADAAARAAAELGAWSEAEYYQRMALAAAPADQHARRWLALGELLTWSDTGNSAADALAQAIEHDETLDGAVAATARIALARSYLATAQYDDAIALAEPMTTHPDARLALDANFVCGTAYSLAGTSLATAAAYLQRAEEGCLALDARDVLPRVLFEQGGIAAQQGDLATAIERYRSAVRAAEAHPDAASVIWRILGYNNLAYHSLLLGQLEQAQRHARTAARLAQRAGVLRLLSYIGSTTGEIALARGELPAAEKSFRDALEYAERFGMPERIAGLHANLGLVAQARGDTAAATADLRRALAQADALGVHHLAAQIRVWLAHIVAADEARRLLADARSIALHGGRSRVLEQIAAIERERNFLPPPSDA